MSIRPFQRDVRQWLRYGPSPRLKPASQFIAMAAAVVVLAWIIFLSYRFAMDARATGLGASLFGQGRVAPVLVVILGAPGAAAGLGLLAYAAPRSATAFRLLTVVALFSALTVATVLTLSSGSGGAALTFAILIGWSWSVGEGLLRLLKLQAGVLAGGARLALATGLGVGVLSFSVFGLALAGGVGDRGLISILVAGSIFGAWGLHTSPSASLAADLRESIGRPPWALFEFVALITVLSTAVFAFGASLAPQSSFDALHYHLAMPRSILAQGHFVERPDIVQSYLPLGLEMTYVPAFRFGSEAAANLMHWCFLPLTAALLWSCGDRLFGRPVGAMAAVLFAVVPLALVDSSTASSDLAMTFYVVATAVLIGAFWEAPDLKTAALAGVFGGLSLAFKIVSAFYLVPLCLVMAYVAIRRGNLASFPRVGAAFIALGLASGAPWLVLRLVETGNPVFPFFNNVFRSDKWPPVNERFDLYLYGIGHGLRSAAEIWWKASVHPSLFGQALPPWSLGLPLLASLALLPALPWLRPSRPALLWTGLAFLALGAWFLGSQYHRYALPTIALLAPPAGAALIASIRAVVPKHATVPAACLAGFWLVLALTTALAIPRPDPYPVRFLLGKESGDEYRERVIPDYLPISFLDGARDDDSDQGLVYGYPYNYFTSMLLYDTNLPSTLSPSRRIAESGLRSGDLARALLAENVRWLVVDRSIPLEDQESSRWLEASLLSPDFLGRYTVAVFERYNVVVYKIVGDEILDGVQ